MPHVSLTLNGRLYRFICEAGEEDHFLELARYLQGKVDGVRTQFGKVGDERILAMAALLVTDELFEARAKSVQPAAQQRMAVPRPTRTAKAAMRPLAAPVSGAPAESAAAAATSGEPANDVVAAQDDQSPKS